MRYFELLNEKIANKPRNLPFYLQKKIAIFDKLLADWEKASRLIQDNEYDGESLATTFLRYGSDHSDAAADVYALSQWKMRDSTYQSFELRNFRDNLDAYMKFGRDFLRYIMNGFEHKDYNPWNERVKAVIDILPLAEKGAEDYGYGPDQIYDDDEEYKASQRYLEGLRLLAHVITESGLQVNEIKEKLGVVYKMMHDYNDNFRPEHDAVETLFHASIHASDLARNGFQAERPTDRFGVGNFGRQDNISFTHDLKIAQDIMRAFKDYWMIAHGQLTPRQILQWMDAEGIDYRSSKFVQTLGIGTPVEQEDPELVKMFGRSTRTKKAHEVSGPEETAQLYNLYLWHTKLRGNPVFASFKDLLKSMQTIDIKDIGIIACEVELTKEHEYLKGEAEFRVPPTAVKSVKRIM